MPAIYRSLILHFAWSTRDRQPYITTKIERRLHRMIQAKSAELGCPVLAINGMPDHVHLLVEMNHNLSCADFMQSLKGASSAFARNTLLEDSAFSWQHGYGVFSVSYEDIPNVIAYIKNQKEHHASPIPEQIRIVPLRIISLDRRETAEERRPTAGRFPSWKRC